MVEGAVLISVSSHEKRLRELPCVVSRRRPVTLHHCHGGSIIDLGWAVGASQKQNPFLQIPLHAKYHTGEDGIDSGYGVDSWERDFGTQAEHLAWVAMELGYDIWEHAKAWEREHRGRSLKEDEQVPGQDPRRR